MTGEKGKLCLVDASALVFRAYHAIRGFTNSEGMATNAIFGYVNMVLKAVRDQQPQYLAVVMDSVGKTFRHDMYDQYKANRPPPPEDLREQFPFIEPITEALGFPSVRAEGFEADDVIATLVRAGEDAGLEVVIVSGDKDLLQLVSDRTTMFDPMKSRIWHSDDVVEKFGVGPGALGDLLALMGDSSDKVPGVRGIGPKGAAKLLQTYGDLAGVLDAAEGITAKKQRESLLAHREDALLSRRLVELRGDAPVPPLEQLVPREQEEESLRKLLTRLEFSKLMSDLLPDAAPAGVESAVEVPEAETIWTEQRLDEVLQLIGNRGRVSVDTETTSTRPMEARLVGISLSCGSELACYIPIGHRGARSQEQLPLGLVREKLSPMLADDSVEKVGQNFKYDIVVLRNNGFSVRGLSFDSMLASYLLDPARRSHSLDNLSLGFLGHKMVSYKEVAGSGASQVTFDKVPIREAARYAAEDAWAAWALADQLGPKVDEAGLGGLLRDVELPLSEMLAEMEMEGVAVDLERLAELSRDYAVRMAHLEKEIHGLAGVPFNLASPKQLSEVLFERLKLPKGRKTKTGYSTDVRVLEELALSHELPAKMLEHRSLSKLKSTYSDVLPTLVNRKTGRIHSSFNQAVTATGRLSSSDPNLQNIPIRGEEGRKIRAAFVPGDGYRFLAADYSQVELRVMAHLAQDEVLMRAFRKGEDIHSRTASEIFRVLPGMVTSEMRRVAKTINFGIVYGMSAFRLSREQQIPLRQAQGFIEAYFARYSGVKGFLDSSVAEARERGYAETILKRRRFLPDLRAKNKQVRSMAERMAVNTPVQGGAADIVKLAMLKLRKRLQKEDYGARVLLQVHDELVLQGRPEAAEEVSALVRETMESAVSLDVPLKVDLGVGDNWEEVHG